MSHFSEESLLLIKHWDTVRDILQAEKQLRKEVNSILLSTESELIKHSWWQDDWAFVRNRESEVYISNQSWRSDDEFIIWIGVEGFAPEGIFGIESPPALYVWVSGKRYDVAQMLSRQFEEGKHEVLGELDRSPKSGYVVRQAVLKCLPEEIEEFEKAVRQQILDFFAHYANTIRSLDEAIQSYLGAS